MILFMEDPVQLLTSKLQKTKFLNLQESRLLSHLLVNPLLNSVKQICNELGIPDSKAYPALKKLEEEELIYRNHTQRPARYIGPEPEKLSAFLRKHLDQSISDKSRLIQEIDRQVSVLWNPDEPSLGQIAYIFKGNAINIEIRRMFKHMKKKAFVLLAPSSLKFSDGIVKEVARATGEGIRIELAFPSTEEFADKFNQLQEIKSPNLKIRQSIYSSNSYIVRDGDTMLNITHRDRGDVALLTNDPLLVDYIASCFDNVSCCVPENPYSIKFDVIN